MPCNNGLSADEGWALKPKYFRTIILNTFANSVYSSFLTDRGWTETFLLQHFVVIIELCVSKLNWKFAKWICLYLKRDMRPEIWWLSGFITRVNYINGLTWNASIVRWFESFRTFFHTLSIINSLEEQTSVAICWQWTSTCSTSASWIKQKSSSIKKHSISAYKRSKATATTNEDNAKVWLLLITNNVCE